MTGGDYSRKPKTGKGKKEKRGRELREGGPDILATTSVKKKTLLLKIFTAEQYGYHLALPNTYSLPRHVLFVLLGKEKSHDWTKNECNISVCVVTHVYST